MKYQISVLSKKVVPIKGCTYCSFHTSKGQKDATHRLHLRLTKPFFSELWHLSKRPVSNFLIHQSLPVSSKATSSSQERKKEREEEILSLLSTLFCSNIQKQYIYRQQCLGVNLANGRQPQYPINNGQWRKKA